MSTAFRNPRAVNATLRGIRPQLVENTSEITRFIPQINGLLDQTGRAGDITLLPQYFLENNVLGCRPQPADLPVTRYRVVPERAG